MNLVGKVIDRSNLNDLTIVTDREAITDTRDHAEFSSIKAHTGCRHRAKHSDVFALNETSVLSRRRRAPNIISPWRRRFSFHLVIDDRSTDTDISQYIVNLLLIRFSSSIISH